MYTHTNHGITITLANTATTKAPAGSSLGDSQETCLNSGMPTAHIVAKQTHHSAITALDNKLDGCARIIPGWASSYCLPACVAAVSVTRRSKQANTLPWADLYATSVHRVLSLRCQSAHQLLCTMRLNVCIWQATATTHLDLRIAYICHLIALVGDSFLK
jgi:hypothetical protein